MKERNNVNFHNKKSNCTKRELKRWPHRQMVDDTAGAPIAYSEDIKKHRDYKMTRQLQICPEIDIEDKK